MIIVSHGSIPQSYFEFNGIKQHNSKPQLVRKCQMLIMTKKSGSIDIIKLNHEIIKYLGDTFRSWVVTCIEYSIRIQFHTHLVDVKIYLRKLDIDNI